MEDIISKIEITKIKNADEILILYPEVDENKKAKIKFDLLNDLKDAEAGNRIIYGAKLNGNIVATIQFIFKMEKEFYADGINKAHLHHARVLESLRGKGIGSFLVKIAENEARKRGFKEITLGVETLNSKAIQLYEKLGYREFMKEKGDEGEEIIGMIKTL